MVEKEEDDLDKNNYKILNKKLNIIHSEFDKLKEFQDLVNLERINFTILFTILGICITLILGFDEYSSQNFFGYFIKALVEAIFLAVIVLILAEAYMTYTNNLFQRLKIFSVALVYILIIPPSSVCYYLLYFFFSKISSDFYGIFLDIYLIILCVQVLLAIPIANNLFEKLSKRFPIIYKSLPPTQRKKIF